MSKKLTLIIDESIIERGKIYAQKTGRSLSSIVVNYLKALVLEYKDIEIEKIISRLSIQLPENFDEDQELREFLEEKHFCKK